MPDARPIPAYPGLEVLSDETVWDGRFPLQRVQFRNRRFNGAASGVRTWELWRRGRAAALLPYDPIADVVVLIEQFRLPALSANLDPIVVEVPAGLCDPGEDPSATLIAGDGGGDGFAAPAPSSDRRTFSSAPAAATSTSIWRSVKSPRPRRTRDGIVGLAGLESENEDIRIRRLAGRARHFDRAGRRIPEFGDFDGAVLARVTA